MAGGSPAAIYGRHVDPSTRRYVLVVPDGSAEPRGRLGAVRPSRVTFVVLLALLGVGLVAGITYAGSRLVSQPIGLAAEPHNLSSSLTAPAAAATTTTSAARTTTTTTTRPATTTSVQPVAPPVATTPVTTNPAFTVPSARHDGHDNDGDDD